MMSHLSPEQQHTVEDQRESHAAPRVVNRPYLFVVLECDRLQGGGARYSLDDIDEVVVGRGPARTALRERKTGRDAVDGIDGRPASDRSARLVLRLPGPALSALHVRLRLQRGATATGVAGQDGQVQQAGAGHGDHWALEDLGSTNGTYVNGTRVGTSALGPDDFIEVGRSFLALRTFEVPNDGTSGDLDSSDAGGGHTPPGFDTLDPRLAAKLEELGRIANSPVTVLVRGETGTGKEVIARSVHALSRRRGPFIAVNCGALTRSLAESQLFGHVKGAFSGAIANSPGFVRAADGGTLLLDEVPDLDPTVQVSLLRVLQEREVVAVGAAQPISVDIRVVAATPRNLPDLVRKGQFRADLMARLTGFTHVVPPLRERRLDLGVLVAALLLKMGVSSAHALRLSPEVGLAMLRHAWPLNIRSLEQLLMRGRVLSKNGLIDMSCAQFSDGDHTLGERTGEGTAGRNAARFAGGPTVRSEPTVAGLTPADLELRSALQMELAAAHGNVAEVARQRGMARMQVYRWLNRLAIDADSYRSRR